VAKSAYDKLIKSAYLQFWPAMACHLVISKPLLIANVQMESS
jgi:hypothetical protein